MRAALIVAASVGVVAAVAAQERIDQDVFWKIRQEAATHSQILKTVHVLSDVYAPRLTGSPNLKAAGEWAVGQMKAWGLVNGALEPFDFGRPGWLNERVAAHIVSPVQDALVVEALGWTPSTNGIVRAEAMQLPMPPTTPTQGELDGYFDRLRPQVKGRIVLAGPPAVIPVNFTPAAMRIEESELIQRLNAPPAQGGGGGGGRGNASPDGPPRLTAAQVGRQLNEFLLASGSPVRINDAAMALGQIRAFNTASYDPTKAPPAVMMRNEDYGRIWRLLESGRRVELEVEIVNRIYPEGSTSYNAVAEIPGTDKADEVVMIGAHLDAWHAGTGATDNAAGSAVVMEAARILTALGLKPRRTIRVALWGGEEQGLLGSTAYVREHFGRFEAPKPAFGKLAGYINIDRGTGRVRSMNVFGPPEAARVLRDILAPFSDVGVVGANSTRSRNRSSSDHGSFNEAGLPGITVEQDPIQYFSFTWHTSLDTYERIVEAEMKQAASVIAATAYHLAMRDELLPRFPAADMPTRPGD